MFRVTVRGAFEGLSDADRARLAAEPGLLGPAYTERGAFTCDRTMTAFSFRCQVPVEDDRDGEAEATARALAALAAHGFPHRVLRVAVTDLRAVKVRRRNRGEVRRG
ncbi:DUF6204 family protein [Streptomyces millisiae]|uniref:DUF6204 family protein n=1 Tax=Streptomyces millisiae TaxID=3075542 RepID=A0ABU2LPK7_9ACTN|nr:DUF6204 family protein [Streptomyces sp. DSM 44918]MDT0319188.1 DUF6204 family protein [Streptomyces sp. DSM 44918]